MKNYQAKNVDEYISSSAAAAHSKLKEIRQLIKMTIPQAEEKIAWGIPFYRFYGPLVGFAVFKDHISFGLGISGLSNEEREALEKKGYVTGKKVVQIGFQQKVPVADVKRILKAQVKINKAKK